MVVEQQMWIKTMSVEDLCKFIVKDRSVEATRYCSVKIYLGLTPLVSMFGKIYNCNFNLLIPQKLTWRQQIWIQHPQIRLGKLSTQFYSKMLQGFYISMFNLYVNQQFAPTSLLIMSLEIEKKRPGFL